jgi:hypothetical protein
VSAPGPTGQGPSADLKRSEAHEADVGVGAGPDLEVEASALGVSKRQIQMNVVLDPA